VSPFDTIVAEDYEAFRPGYPAKTVAWLVEHAGLGRTSAVGDVAAGTGKLTRMLLQQVDHVVAVEPAGVMRTVLLRAAPKARVVAAEAERLPFRAGDLDAITVAHALHHFDLPLALPEFRRVLGPAGFLALFWRRHDPEDPLNHRLGDLVDRYVDLTSGIPLAFFSWRERFDRTGVFEEVDRLWVPDPYSVPSAALGRLMATSSDVASLAEPRRESLIRDVETLARELPSTVQRPGVVEVQLFRPR
jgi:SAM-dependent methyltransferase